MEMADGLQEKLKPTQAGTSFGQSVVTILLKRSALLVMHQHKD